MLSNIWFDRQFGEFNNEFRKHYLFKWNSVLTNSKRVRLSADTNTRPEHFRKVTRRLTNPSSQLFIQDSTENASTSKFWFIHTHTPISLVSTDKHKSKFTFNKIEQPDTIPTTCTSNSCMFQTNRPTQHDRNDNVMISWVCWLFHLCIHLPKKYC